MIQERTEGREERRFKNHHNREVHHILGKCAEKSAPKNMYCDEEPVMGPPAIAFSKRLGMRTLEVGLDRMGVTVKCGHMSMLLWITLSALCQALNVFTIW